MHEITIKTDLLASNDNLARHNREHFGKHKVYVCNLMSSPGAGKTTLLEKSLKILKKSYNIGVIEGDLQSEHDALRIRKMGVYAVQINTAGACHLDASMICKELSNFDLNTLDLLIIENVGNLVCPAEFDLGEDDKVMLLSVTEGDDKPLKYPVMFHRANLLVIHKIDLIPYTDFDQKMAISRARALNRNLCILPVSSRTGEGVEDFCSWVVEQIEAKKESYYKW